MLIRILLLIVVLVLLRRVLGWAFRQAERVAETRTRRERMGRRSAARRAETESLSDQQIDEADYEELR